MCWGEDWMAGRRGVAGNSVEPRFDAVSFSWLSPAFCGIWSGSTVCSGLFAWMRKYGNLIKSDPTPQKSSWIRPCSLTFSQTTRDWIYDAGCIKVFSIWRDSIIVIRKESDQRRIWIIYGSRQAKRVPSNKLKINRFRSSFACAKYHPGLCSPFTHSVVSNECWWTVKALIRAVWSGPSLFTYVRRHVIAWRGPCITFSRVVKYVDPQIFVYVNPFTPEYFQ